MMKKAVFMGILMVVSFSVSLSFSAYHHMGEKDSGRFLSIYPDKAGTKLDHCALCHSGGQYEKKGNKVNLGSCQWCHYSYGYDGSGNILTTINAYGKAYHDAGRNAAAVKAIENIDSDGDGFTNKEEIEASRFPGDAGDDPTKKVAPFRVYSKAQLEAMPQHTQFLLMNTSRQGDFYAEYTGVPMETLLNDAGILDSATGIKAYAPDGWSNYHPLDPDPDPELYHIRGVYPPASFQYDSQADTALGGWCDYSAPSCAGRNHNDPIFVKGGLKAILAVKRDGAYLTPGILTKQNTLDGEGPFRLVVPQKTATPPDQSSTSKNQNVIWPYENTWDHNAGSCSRSVTIIKVEPLPPGTTDIDILEAGWNYVDQEKIIIYGAIKDTASPAACSGDLNADGSISPQDALIAFRCYLGLVPCPECADVNGDGTVTPVDALCLFHKYLGQPSCFD
ncbi:MAG: GEGP motif-containing diheme protein [bacterium]